MTAPGPPIPYNSTRLILVSLLSALALVTITCSDPLSGSAPTPVPTPKSYARSGGGSVCFWCTGYLAVGTPNAESKRNLEDVGPPQFTSLEFTQVLKDRGVKISMDGKGRYADNIFVERLWRTVKYEEVYLKAYASSGEARRELGAYFRFYNDQRPHQALGYRTPGEVFSEGRAPKNEESTAQRWSPEADVVS